MSGWRLGIIGGSGLYALPGLEGAAWQDVQTPWGKPSDAILTGRLGHIDLAFLPRHGRGHRIPPHALPARANIAALKMLGCTDILAVSAVGSLADAMAPGDFAVVRQLIDHTSGRPSTFFDTGLVAHVSLADPVCPRLSELAASAARAAGAKVHDAATYLAMEGPAFSTRAESRLYRQWGAELIGMTAMPEARLAREAELPYALLAMITDYDSWREGEAVSVADILAVMHANAATARETIARLVGMLPAERTPSPIDSALDHALITAPEARDAAAIVRLAAIAGRVLG